jgi:hypothetical protein
MQPVTSGCISLCLTVFAIGAIENPKLLKNDFYLFGFGEIFLCFLQMMFTCWKYLSYKVFLRNLRRVK